VEAQIIDEMSNADGSPSDIGIKLDYIDTAFTVVFTIELLINAYAYWFRCPAPRRVLKARFCPLAIPGDDLPLVWCCRPYISDGWNIFDIIVVSLSLVALGPIAMPINVLRYMRAESDWSP
jgi:hypothetical protein